MGHDSPKLVKCEFVGGDGMVAMWGWRDQNRWFVGRMGVDGSAMVETDDPLHAHSLWENWWAAMIAAL